MEEVRFPSRSAWSEAIQRRLAEIDPGTIELISWKEVAAELLSHLNEELSYGDTRANT